MNKQTVRDVAVDGKRVLVRVDFNVPLDKASRAISDDTRIRAALPTIEYLRQHGAKIVLVSHLGRPDGKVNEGLRLRPVAARLQQLLGAPVVYVEECTGQSVQQAVDALSPGGVVLLENVRFYAGEEANDPKFARQLAALADVYVNDAFGTAHRAHASTEGVAHLLPAVAGLLMEKELDFLGRATQNPERPYAAVIGGAKVSDKIAVLQRLADLVDKLIIGGGMANTFLRAQGYPMGASLVETDRLDAARDIMERASARGIKLMLPVDLALASHFAADAGRKVIALDPAKKDVGEELVPAGWMALDIGPATVEAYGRALQDCKTIVWNGPMGVFEFPNFAVGTTMIADAVAGVGAVSIVGGGETAAAVESAGVANRITHISTGGGASLEFLEGKVLPGAAALSDR
jgi:phosphoglycerate kinase